MFLPEDAAMLRLPSRFAVLILSFAPLFRHRSWQYARGGGRRHEGDEQGPLGIARTGCIGDGLAHKLRTGGGGSTWATSEASNTPETHKPPAAHPAPQLNPNRYETGSE